MNSDYEKFLIFFYFTLFPKTNDIHLLASFLVDFRDWQKSGMSLQNYQYARGFEFTDKLEEIQQFINDNISADE